MKGAGRQAHRWVPIVLLALAAIGATVLLSPGAMSSRAAGLVAATGRSQGPASEGIAEESGSLEFVVTSVIGRALNVPGTY